MIKTDKHENSLGNEQQKRPSSLGRGFRPQKKEPKESTYRTDFVIITALDEEFKSVLSKFSQKRRIYYQAYNIYDAELTTKKSYDQQHYRIIIACQARMGQANAAALTTLLCEQYKPHYILLVGIAGGKKNEVKLGDVMVADAIVDTSEGEIKEGKRKPRWRQFQVDTQLLNISKHDLANDQNWHSCLNTWRSNPEKPKVHHAPIFSSCDVIKDDQITNEYQETWKKAIGVEMESGGVAIAVSDYIKQPKPGLFMVRGVSDFADDNKNSAEVSKWREYACDVAASYTYALLESGLVLDLNKST